MTTEIIIDKSALQDAEQKLKNLKSIVGNQNFSVSFSSAKGDIVDELLKLSQRLSEIGVKLSELYGNTADALAETRKSFDETDNSIANYFNTFWERIDEK